jgi:hypothetical protein
MRVYGLLTAVVVTAALVSGCGDDDTGAGEGSTSTSVATTTTVATTTSGEAVTPTSAPVGLEQPAIWPAADVVFDTPEQAAEDFVAAVLGVPPRLGEFQQGDGRSGEIEVLAPGETDEGSTVARSLLLLRQLGADNGWFVLAAVNDKASISSPEASAEVTAGPVTVEGVGRGFEALVVVEAFRPGDPVALDQVITQGGSTETAEPFTVQVDLSGAEPGEVVMLLVRGGVGLETDPGDFGAIPVVITR